MFPNQYRKTNAAELRKQTVNRLVRRHWSVSLLAMGREQVKLRSGYQVSLASSKLFSETQVTACRNIAYGQSICQMHHSNNIGMRTQKRNQSAPWHAQQLFPLSIKSFLLELNFGDITGDSLQAITAVDHIDHLTLITMHLEAFSRTLW